MIVLRVKWIIYIAVSLLNYNSVFIGKMLILVI